MPGPGDLPLGQADLSVHHHEKTNPGDRVGLFVSLPLTHGSREGARPGRSLLLLIFARTVMIYIMAGIKQ